MGNSAPAAPKHDVRVVSGTGELTPDDASFLAYNLHTHGYAVIAISHADLNGVFTNVRTDAMEFLDKDQEYKDTFTQELVDSNNSVGYVGPGRWREYLKLRYQEQNTPGQPESLSDSYDAAFVYMRDIVWKVWRGTHTYFTQIPEASVAPLEDDDWDDVFQCISERSSYSVIRYYAAGNEGEIATSDDLKEGDLLEDGTVCICGTHRDTGVFTIVCVGDVPGLQIQDKANDEWIEVEKVYAAKRQSDHPDHEYFVIMMGEKASLFVEGSLEATRHRVTIPAGIERTSMLFFTDTAQIK